MEKKRDLDKQNFRRNRLYSSLISKGLNYESMILIKGRKLKFRDV